jgi:predicted nuclease of predicted toxin-antitoxin system
MTFLIDAQLPRRLARRLAASGHDALHTLDLPAGNRTPDSQVIEVADRNGRIVVTKDDDFVTSRVLHGRPRRLVLVSVGNTSNDDLERHLFSHLESIVELLADEGFVEVTTTALVIHE